MMLNIVDSCIQSDRDITSVLVSLPPRAKEGGGGRLKREGPVVYVCLTSLALGREDVNDSVRGDRVVFIECKLLLVLAHSVYH